MIVSAEYHIVIIILFYYLSDLSKDWVAPKGIACSRVLPTTNTKQINTELYLIQQKNKLQKQITKQNKS